LAKGTERKHNGKKSKCLCMVSHYLSVYYYFLISHTQNFLDNSYKCINSILIVKNLLLFLEGHQTIRAHGLVIEFLPIGTPSRWYLPQYTTLFLN